MSIIKSVVIKFLHAFRSPSLYIIKKINLVLRQLLAFTHKCQLYCEWAIKPNPEWFDHFIDQYYSWPDRQNPLCWERGIFNLLALRRGAIVLELCCGDGFNAHHFYSIRSKHVTAVDFDPLAIRHLRA